MIINFQKSIAIILVSLICLCNVVSQNPFEVKSRIGEEQFSQEQTVQPDSLVDLSSESIIVLPDSKNPFEKSLGESKAKKPALVNKTSERIVNSKSSEIGTVPKAIILLVSFFFLFLIRNMNQNVVQNLFDSVLNSSKLVAFKNSFTGMLTLQLSLFYAFFFFNVAYFFYNAHNKLEWSSPYSGIKLYGLVFLGVFVIYLIKYLTLYLLEYGLDIRRAVGLHLFSVSVHNIILGLILFVINVFFPFAEGGFGVFLFYLGIAVIAGFYLFRQIKSLPFLSEMRQFNLFHFFIYLCACEISPLLVVYKYIVG